MPQEWLRTFTILKFLQDTYYHVLQAHTASGRNCSICDRHVNFNLGIFHCSLHIYEYILNYAIRCIRLIFNLARYHPYTLLFSVSLSVTTVNSVLLGYLLSRLLLVENLRNSTDFGRFSQGLIAPYDSLFVTLKSFQRALFIAIGLRPIAYL